MYGARDSRSTDRLRIAPPPVHGRTCDVRGDAVHLWRSSRESCRVGGSCSLAHTLRPLRPPPQPPFLLSLGNEELKSQGVGEKDGHPPAVLRCRLGNEASPAGAPAKPHGADGFCVGRNLARLVWKVATMPALLDCLAVCAGGALGSLARYFISLAPFKSVGDAGFPLATLVTNIVGAFVIGLIVATVAAGHELDSRLVLFLKVGVCGGFTTFSTFALESVGLVQRGEPLVAVVYVMLSAGLGMGAVLLAQQVAA